MTDKMANFSPPQKPISEIKVVGIGGGGGNAVNHMFLEGIRDVDFIICNTDAQALDSSPIPTKVQLGSSLTEGRGAGNKPETGKQATLENIEDVRKVLAENTKMVFITAGMGGGTGTGGAPVIAELCKDLGFLTVGIVTIPFKNEGRRRIKQAIDGIVLLGKYVDSLLIINNERIREMFGDFGISEAFSKADGILGTAAKGIAEIITVPGYINVDFADVETVMRKSGLAIMGTGLANGENRAITAIEKALNSPLLNNNDIRGAKNILLNITSDEQEVTMDEVGQITDYVQNKAGFDADIIWGNGKDDSLGTDISVTIIATGFSSKSIPDSHTDKSEEEIRPTIIEKLSKSKPKDLGIPKSSGNKLSQSTSQKTIEFNISEEQRKEEEEFAAMYPQTSKERSSNDKKHTLPDYSLMSDEEVDELENIPAFKRRQLRMNDPKYKKNQSDLKVNRDNKLMDKNPYLHKNVD